MNIQGKNATEALKENTNSKTLKSFIVKMSDQIGKALPNNITPDRMVRIALTAISKNQQLCNSTQESFMGALLTAAQLGLECNTPLGQAYLIPYFNSKIGKYETQFQIGYQGLLDICYRTGQYRKIQARIVYDGDTFNYNYGLDENLVHIPCGKSENPQYVYAHYELINGAKGFEVMSWSQVMEHAHKYSKAKSSSPWQSDPEAMAKKTVLKRVLKYAPKAVEVAESISGDSAVINASINNGEIEKEFDYSGVVEGSFVDVTEEQNAKTEKKENVNLENFDQSNNPNMMF